MKFERIIATVERHAYFMIWFDFQQGRVTGICMWNLHANVEMWDDECVIETAARNFGEGEIHNISEKAKP